MDFVGPMVDKVCSESHRGAGDENAMKQARRNHYQILEVPHAASPDEIKKAFREKAKRFHPDRQSGGEAEEEDRALRSLITDLEGRSLERNPRSNTGDRGGLVAQRQSLDLN